MDGMTINHIVSIDHGSCGFHGFQPQKCGFHGFLLDFSIKIHGFHVGLLDGLLGVAGMMTLLVMTGIPENSQET